MKILQTHIVPDGTPKERLSDYACRIFTHIPSRKSIKKSIKRGEILIDNEPANTGRWVQPGQKIQWVDLEKEPPRIFQKKLNVVWEDAHLAVIQKPAGIKVSGNDFRTIANTLLFNLKKSQAEDALRIPQPVHRLDAPTSGLLLVAKTASAQIHLSQQFENRTIRKKYQAIVIGKIGEEGTIEFSIDGKDSLTKFKRVKFVPSLKNEWLSWVDLFPLTGRTHQLRIHLSKLGFPILGDSIYGKEGLILKHKGLFLSAVELEFEHPISQKKLQIKIDAPPKFETRLASEYRRFKRYHKS